MDKKHEIKEKTIEFAVLRTSENILQTEIRDEEKIYEIYGFLKSYVEALGENLKNSLEIRDDDEKQLY